MYTLAFDSNEDNAIIFMIMMMIIMMMVMFLKTVSITRMAL